MFIPYVILLLCLTQINQTKMNSLTPRETEILLLILEETSTVSIAEKLHISRRTVDTHRRNILNKSQSSNLIGLYKYAIKNKIINLSNETK